MNWQLLLDSLIGPGLFTSSVLGLMIGATYGFDTLASSGLRYPWSLWTIGLAFVVSLGILGATEANPITVEASIARAVLWSILCAAIPAGRWLRIRFETLRLRRRKEKIENGL